MISSRYSSVILSRISLGLILCLTLGLSFLSTSDLSAKPRKRAKVEMKIATPDPCSK